MDSTNGIHHRQIIAVAVTDSLFEHGVGFLPGEEAVDDTAIHRANVRVYQIAPECRFDDRDCSSVSDNRGAVRVEVAVQEYRNTRRKLPRVHLISRLETMMKMNKA